MLGERYTTFAVLHAFVLCPQVACFGTRTTTASEELVTACMADGRGARFGSGLTVAQGGCTEPRSAAADLTCLYLPACRMICISPVASHLA